MGILSCWVKQVVSTSYSHSILLGKKLSNVSVRSSSLVEQNKAQEQANERGIVVEQERQS